MMSPKSRAGKQNLYKEENNSQHNNKIFFQIGKTIGPMVRSSSQEGDSMNDHLVMIKFNN